MRRDNRNGGGCRGIKEWQRIAEKVREYVEMDLEEFYVTIR